LVSVCPEGWSDQRRQATAGIVLATLRGLLLDLLTSSDEARARASLNAFLTLLERTDA